MKQWFEQQKTRACVPHTPYTSVLKFVSPAGRVYGAATHAVGGDAGYGLLSSLELAATLTDITVDLETRAQERPSDHAPVIAEFDC